MSRWPGAPSTSIAVPVSAAAENSASKSTSKPLEYAGERLAGWVMTFTSG